MTFTLIQLVLFLFVFSSTSSTQFPIDYNESWSVTLLREYVRINTAHPHPEEGYVQAINFLGELAADIGLDFDVVIMEPPNLFAVVITWRGLNPDLKSIVLSSHMDVVAADPENWMYPPFEAFKTPEGRIYGRGVMDMKSHTIARLEAIRQLKFSGFQPLRTVYNLVMPDEELGGLRGMKPFLETDYFKNMNVGLDIDEGHKSLEINTTYISYAEKNSWKFKVTATGIPSHGASFPQYTAPQRLQVVIDRLMEFRQQQYITFVKQNEILSNITTINLVRLGGGISDNSIPSEVWASYDMRIWETPELTFTDVDKMLDAIIEEARLGSDNPKENVTIDFMVKSEETGRTSVDDSNPWWTALQQACKEINLLCKPVSLNAATDGRFFRNLGIATFGIHPFPNCSSGGHVDNESIDEINYFVGIDRYAKLISSLAMVPKSVFP